MYLRLGFRRRCPIRQYAWKLRDLGQPAPVVFPLDVDPKLHGATLLPDGRPSAVFALLIESATPSGDVCRGCTRPPRRLLEDAIVPTVRKPGQQDAARIAVNNRVRLRLILNGCQGTVEGAEERRGIPAGCWLSRSQISSRRSNCSCGVRSSRLAAGRVMPPFSPGQVRYRRHVLGDREHACTCAPSRVGLMSLTPPSSPRAGSSAPRAPCRGWDRPRARTSLPPGRAARR